MEKDSMQTRGEILMMMGGLELNPEYNNYSSRWERLREMIKEENNKEQNEPPTK